MAALSQSEQADALRFLGYANWSSLAQSFQLGFPAPSQPEFLVREAFRRIDEEGLERVRLDLCELRDIECQLHSARRRMKATRIGNLATNPNETMQLRRELRYWVGRLSDDLGAPVNPFASDSVFAGGINAKVVND
jgi:hypothetical protein